MISVSSKNPHAPLPIVIPEAKIALAQSVSESVPTDSLAFEIVNFAESNLWIKALHLVNDHGIPETSVPAIREWAERSFRLNETTQRASQLREGKIDRSACMETNRKAGATAMLYDLSNVYLLLQDFHLSGIEVSLPDNDSALDQFTLKGTAS